MVAPRVLCPNDVVLGAEKLLARLLGEDIDLRTELDPLAGHVRADRGQLEQVLVNLAINARDAMPGGGMLTIATHAEEAVPDAAGAGRYTVIEVSDTGCGIPEASLPRIFEAFFTTKQVGTGLGLSTVQSIVEQCGGQITVRTTPGEGSTFSVFLPQVEEPRAAAPSPQPRSLEGKETILLVEDEPSVRHMVREILRLGGFTVLEAESGDQALEVSSQWPGDIHVLLTDLVMPGMSGRELAETLCPLRPEMQVIYMSGYTDDHVLRHGVFMEQHAFLQKPFTAAQLAERLEEQALRRTS